jgi:hypothetical protein
MTARLTVTATRVVQIVLDVAATLGAIVIGVFVAVELLSVTLTAPAVVGLSIFATIAMIAVAPGLVVLYVSAPRRPLRERSALVASATWFIRAAWSAVVFALAIVIGSVAGALASKSLESASDLSAGVQQAWNGLLETAFGPIVLTVTGVTFVVMVLRWGFDLRTIVRDGDALAAVKMFEQRWTGNVRESDAAQWWRNLITSVLIKRVSLIALFVLTVGLGIVLIIDVPRFFG